ncbi:MAG: signal peptidase II [Micavibrio aeruginosavorus]|uniref:Lipoprotein signal peptidase n=1 Tax=Micavibrio aeruginosavorus TaxID=349221 RepID=A0A2W5FLS6_9BACT|nr:MAG: signal peptidase II [Micavibrio aeruginosavorus]
MSQTTRFLIGLFIIIALAFLDQWSKWYIIEMYFRPRDFYAEGASLDFWSWLTTMAQERFPPYQIEITSFFNFVMVWNKGVSFGMFASTHSFMPYALMIMALALTIFFIIWLWRSTSLLAALPLAMVISGALSNVWDRARFGAVADFLDFHVAGYHWPAFNIADSCIVLGVAGLALHTLFSAKDNTTGNTVSDQV